MKISVITAVLNRRDTIQAALDSLARQDHAEVEHIVVDGGSVDGTIEILEANCRRVSVLVSEKDRGIYDALNKGIALASGDVIGFLHADDVFADGRVLSRIAQVLSDPRVDAAYGDLVYVRRDDLDRVVRHWRAGPYSRSRLAWGWMPPHPTFYVRRSVYERLGGFDARHRIAADYDCVLRFLGAGGVVPAYIPEILVRMRLGGASNASLRRILRKSWEDYVALRENGVGGVGALAWKNFGKLGQFWP